MSDEHPLYSSSDMETFEISSYKARKKDILGELSVASVVNISEKTHSKSIPPLILRDQPTLYKRWFTRYEKSSNFVVRRPYKTKICIFRAFPVA